jgi:hypothetical protein
LLDKHRKTNLKLGFAMDNSILNQKSADFGVFFPYSIHLSCGRAFRMISTRANPVNGDGR